MNIRCVHYVYTYMIYIQNEHLHIYLRLSNTYTSPCTYSLIRDEHIHTDMHNIHTYKAANIVRQEHICKRSFAYASKVYTHTYTKHRYTTATTRTTSSTHMSTHTYAPINIYMLNKTQTNAQERIHTRRLIHKHRPFHTSASTHAPTNAYTLDGTYPPPPPHTQYIHVSQNIHADPFIHTDQYAHTPIKTYTPNNTYIHTHIPIHTNRSLHTQTNIHTLTNTRTHRSLHTRRPIHTHRLIHTCHPIHTRLHDTQSRPDTHVLLLSDKRQTKRRLMMTRRGLDAGAGITRGDTS